MYAYVREHMPVGVVPCRAVHIVHVCVHVLRARVCTHSCVHISLQEKSSLKKALPKEFDADKDKDVDRSTRALKAALGATALKSGSQSQPNADAIQRTESNALAESACDALEAIDDDEFEKRVHAAEQAALNRKSPDGDEHQRGVC